MEMKKSDVQAFFEENGIAYKEEMDNQKPVWYIHESGPDNKDFLTTFAFTSQNSIYCNING